MVKSALRQNQGSEGRGKHVFEVQVYLSGLDPNSARVELYADAVNSGEPVRQEMKRVRQLLDKNGTIYSVQVPTTPRRRTIRFG